MMPLVYPSASCRRCSRYQGTRRTRDGFIVACQAYKAGVPADIRLAFDDHKTARKGDGGLTFQEVKA